MRYTVDDHDKKRHMNKTELICQKAAGGDGDIECTAEFSANEIKKIQNGFLWLKSMLICTYLLQSPTR